MRIVVVRELPLGRKNCVSLKQPSQVIQFDLVALRVLCLGKLVLVDLAKHLPNVHVLDLSAAEYQVDLVYQFVDLVSDYLMYVEVKQHLSFVELLALVIAARDAIVLVNADIYVLSWASLSLNWFKQIPWKFYPSRLMFFQIYLMLSFLINFLEVFNERFFERY